MRERHSEVTLGATSTVNIPLEVEQRTQTKVEELRATFVGNPLATELRERDQWVVYQLEKRDGKTTKVPYVANLARREKAKSDDPTSWSSFEKAMKVLEFDKFDGVGFVFSEDDPYVGIDIDKCRNQDTGELNRVAQWILAHFGDNVYTDISPSGSGIHLITRAQLSKARKLRLPGCAVEIYSSGRYFTMTGNQFRRMASKSAGIGDGQPSLDALLPLLEVVAQANKKGTTFSTYFEGLDEGDTSENDLSLISQLRHAGATLEQADTVFRLSARMRPKWDEVHNAEQQTYGQMTLGKAYSGAAGNNGSGADISSPYVFDHNQTVLERLVKGEIVRSTLSNFVARITREITRDDGVEQSKLLEIMVTLQSGRSQSCVIPASQFSGMNWLMEKCGPDAIVYAGNGYRDHVRAAIQANSTLEAPVQKQWVRAHTGWTVIDGTHHYLTALGAIGPEGLMGDVAVDLEGLSLFTVEAPPDVKQLQRDIKALWNLLETGPSHVMLVLLASAFAVVLMETPFSLFLLGRTGVGKTQLAALWQSFWGAGLTASTLPGNWSSTANSLEGLASAAKDAGLVVDDLAPEGSESDVKRMLANANRLLRGQGNRQGRGRMRADTTQRPQIVPRGLLLITGEDLPRMGSIIARTVVMEVQRGQVSWERLSQAQKDAADGCFARILAHVIREVAADFEGLRGRVQARKTELRAEITAPHARSVDALAALQAALETTLPLFAAVMSEQERENLAAHSMEIMRDLAVGQRQFQGTVDPVRRVVELLHTVVRRGQAHLINRQGGAPDNPEQFGWSLNHRKDGGVYQPQGNRIGAVSYEGEEHEVWHLYPQAAFAEVQKLAREQGDSIQFSQDTVWRALGEAGYLERKEEGTWRAKVTINSQRTHCVNFRPNHGFNR